MGYLIQLSDLQNLGGITNVQTWSSLDGSGTLDTNRVNTAIAWAEGEVNNAFRGSRFAVPLSGTASGALLGVADCAARLACWWLYTSRGVRDKATDTLLGAWEKHAREMLNKYKGGSIRLAAALVFGFSPECPIPVG